MIQRVQTIYLLLAAAAMGALGFLSLSAGNNSNSYAILLAASAALVFLLALITVFLYGNRQRQMRLCRVSLAALFLLAGASFLLVHVTGQLSEAANRQWFVPLAVFAMLIVSLALRAIRKDEELVRGADRLR